MRKLIFIAIFLMFLPMFALADVRVEGYKRSDGTYVKPHYRSKPNKNFYDNWSTKPNINPHTGEKGTKVTPPNRSKRNYDIHVPKANKK